MSAERTRQKKVLTWTVIIVAVVALIIAAVLVNHALIHRESRPSPSGPTDADYEKQIDALRSSNVKTEVDAAWAKGDRRFLCVLGKNAMFPGVPVELRPMTQSGRRVIPYTSDIAVSDAHARYQDVAKDYARKYNTYLVQKLKAEEKAKSVKP